MCVGLPEEGPFKSRGEVRKHERAGPMAEMGRGAPFFLGSPAEMSLSDAHGEYTALIDLIFAFSRAQYTALRIKLSSAR